LDELRGALTAMADVSPAKFDAFLEMVFAAPPATIDFWQTLLIQCRGQRHLDLPDVFRRMSAHLAATANPELPWLHSAAAMDRLVPIECGDVLGINPERARIMLDACVALIRWTGRRGLLAETDAAKAEKFMVTLMKKIDG
jgi:hypothetical protein